MPCSRRGEQPFRYAALYNYECLPDWVPCLFSSENNAMKQPKIFITKTSVHAFLLGLPSSWRHTFINFA